MSGPGCGNWRRCPIEAYHGVCGFVGKWQDTNGVSSKISSNPLSDHQNVIDRLQLCVNVQIPKCLHGLEGAAIFIDTNRDFSPARLRGEHLLPLSKPLWTDDCQRHCQQVAAKRKIHNQSMQSFTVDNILANVICTSCNSQLDLLMAIHNLWKVLLNNSRVICMVWFHNNGASVPILFRSD